MSQVAISERTPRVEAAIKSILLELSGFNLDELDKSVTFLELGFDSLFLIQFSQALKKKLNLKVSFRQLIEEIGNFAGLINYVDQKADESVLPAAATSAPAPVQMASADAAPPIPAPAASAPVIATTPTAMSPAPVMPPVMQMSSFAPTNPADVTGLEAIMAHQLQIMAQQLDMLRGYNSAPVAAPTHQPPPATQPVVPAVLTTPVANPVAEQPQAVTIPAKAKPDPAQLERKRFGPYKPIKRGKDGGLTERQQKHLDDLVQRFCARTATSKELAQQHRPHFADPRGIAGFRQLWKEMVYQITTVRSAGSKLWDIDGNEYIDVAMGFGLNLFGQSPDFITKAVADQLALGVEIGPQSPLAGEVAKLMCELTGMERVTFCNTGSEAVMAAIRLARTVSGRTKFAFFSSAYHGNFDQVIVRASVIGGQRRMTAAAPGVPDNMADNVLVLDYGDPASLDILRAHAHELAAVIVEPVQSAQPDLQPREFLQELRALTAEADIALVVDEVITGFRAAPGGAQEWFGIQADMATYGKIIGGGMPMGALAGKAKYMDALDSGMWQYGDDSVPEEDMTFFAGTFVRHPLALAAAKVVLERVKADGPALQEGLSNKTAYVVDTLNAYFMERQVPIRLQRFRSLFRFSYASDMEYIDMLYYHLLDKGIFTRGFLDNCFLSTAHSDEDIEKIISAVKESVAELQAGGFLPEPGASDAAAKGSQDAAGEHDFFLQAPHWHDETVGRRYELTEAQREIWLGSQVSAEASSAFNEPFTLHLRGALNESMMRRSIQAVVARHQALHMRFGADGDYQTPAAPLLVEVPLVDLVPPGGALNEQAKGVTVAAIMAAEASAPFDLQTGPLIRVKILRLAADEHVLAFSAHHIVCDGWSWGVLLDEIGALYSAACQGTEPELDEPTPFSEYSTELAQEQASPEGTDAYSYWVAQFADLPEPLNLPTDRPRPKVKSHKGGSIRLKFEGTAYQAIKQAAAEQGSSLYVALLAAFKVLMARLAGQEDVVVTIPTAGQATAGMDALVGHCVNFLPLRAQANADKPFSTFLAEVQSLLLESYDYQGCTFGGIVERLHLPRRPDRLPLSEVTFNLDRDDARLNFYGLEPKVAQARKNAVIFDIFFNVNELSDGLIVDCDYNTDLYDEETMVRWIRCYEALMASIATNPDELIGQLSLLNEAERQQLRVDWNATSAAYRQDATVDQLFAEQVERTPNSVAVIYEDTQLTYSEIERRANQLAHYLRQQGVERGTLVGIALERSLETAITILAVLKAGGAYVPLDPTYPVERIAFMVADSQAPIVVTTRVYADKVASDKARFILLDAESDRIAQCAETKVPTPNHADDVAYVIYTSGSTGTPKGVRGLHRGIVNRCSWMWSTYPFGADEVCCHKTSLNFVDSVWEIFGPLLQGVPTVYVADKEAQSAPNLVRVLAEQRVTRLVLVPSLLRSMLELIPNLAEELPALNQWVTSGEELALDLCQKFYTQVPNRTLLNLYGSSEVAADVTYFDTTELGQRSFVPIGKPIQNTEIYIVDGQMQLVPVGVPGEIYVGGHGLAGGYLHRPDLTAERFVHHPFNNRPNAVLYKTGDLGRWGADGEIEYLGRVDYQVKVRGFRIELGEIEAQLAKHPAIKEKLVVLREDRPGDPRLIAYIISQGATLESSELRTYLQKSLPNYMIPSAFVFMDAFPLTPNGKIDRRHLPAPDAQLAELQRTRYVAPATPIEREVAEVWQDVLKIERIGLYDNYFELGGHSLLATRILSRLRTMYGVELSLQNLFEAPSVGELAQTITAMLASQENEDELLALMQEVQGLSAQEIAELLN